MATKNELLVQQIKERQTKTIVKDRPIETELKASFMEYAMSVIVSRALPDVRDGLKPVHRRVLYAASELGMSAGSAYKKSARLVGEIIGKYHPHGDIAVYETIVRMAQDFSLRYPLIDGHGNFGSIDGDGAAAMRYTEVRLSKIAMEMLSDIKKDTVDFRENYDGSETEPVVLPAGIPNLLINGSTGIAVGMSTNIPPHNLSEIIDALIACVRNRNLTSEELIKIIPGPDFPTGADLLNTSGIMSYLDSGKGSLIIRSKVDIEQYENGKSRIIVNEIPYGVNKSNLITRIVELVTDKQILGISDLKDESNMKGIRIIIDLKREAVPEVILNQLYKQTQLQVSFPANMLALDAGRPRLVGIKDALLLYYEHQLEVLIRKTKFELNKAKERHHIVAGLVIATNNIDEVIQIIRSSDSVEHAHFNLIAQFSLTEIQAKAITEMRLARLTGLERQKLEDEMKSLELQIADMEDLLISSTRQTETLISFFEEIKAKYGDERRTTLRYDITGLIEDEDLIPVEEIAITISKKGYIKRIPIETYRTQHRGGVGVKATKLNEDDDVERIVVTSTHTDLLIFTNVGKVYRIRAHQVPPGSRISKGIPYINVIDVEKTETIAAVLALNDYQNKFLFFATRKGTVKRTSADQFESINRNGKRAISLEEGDSLLNVMCTGGDAEIFLASSNGKVVRFNEPDVRAMGRSAMGVIGMRLSDGEEVVGLSSSLQGSMILSIGEKGLGKVTHKDAYRKTLRGASGVISLKITERTGKLVYCSVVKGNEDIMLITSDGQTIRTSLGEVSNKGRIAQGVYIMRIEGDMKIVSAAIFETDKETVQVDRLEKEPGLESVEESVETIQNQAELIELNKEDLVKD